LAGKAKALAAVGRVAIGEARLRCARASARAGDKASCRGWEEKKPSVHGPRWAAICLHLLIGPASFPLYFLGRGKMYWSVGPASYYSLQENFEKIRSILLSVSE
jgi:hypothetical protein